MNIKEKIANTIFSLIDIFTKLLPLKNQIVFESNPDFADNTFFLYQKMLESEYNKKYKMYWILNNSKKDYELPENVYAIRLYLGSPIEKIKAHWQIARSKYIIDCNRYIYKIHKKQKRIYLKHGLPMKSVPEYNLMIGNVDVISVPSEYWIPYCAEEHHVDPKIVKPLGFPRNDILKSVEHQSKNIIWMPTWTSRELDSEEENARNPFIENMPFGLPCLQTYEQIDEVNNLFKSHNAYLYIRLHPSQNTSSDCFANKSNIIVCNDAFLKSQNTTLYKFLCKTDALISDYSSIYYDYLRLDKPIALVTKYYNEYKDACGLIKYSFDEFKTRFPANFVNSYEELLGFFNNIFEGKDPAELIRKETMGKYMPVTYSDSSENIINYMKENFNF